MPVTVTKDALPELEKALKALGSTRIMAGIPMDSDKNPRDDSPLTNAQIGYIQETGAPEANIPPRPFLVPGVEAIKDQVVTRLKAIGKDAMAGKATAVDQGMHALGLVAQNAVRRYMTTAAFAPLAPATIAARRRRHKGRKATTAADVRPLIDTGALRGAITYAIRKIKGK